MVQRLAQAIDRRGEAVIKANERAIRPKPLPQFLASYQFAGPLDESGQQRQRLVGEILFADTFAEQSGASIELEGAKADGT